MTDKKEFVTYAELMQNPIIKELSDSVVTLGDSTVTIPYVIKDKVLMAPGVWNDKYYSKESILSAHKITDWSDRYNSQLFYDHEDEKASEWIGEVKNIKTDEESGFQTGDLYIYNPIAAITLGIGKPKMGISPKVEGTTNGREMYDYTFKNYSVVINPAVKKAYINNSQGSKPIILEDGKMSECVKAEKPKYKSCSINELENGFEISSYGNPEIKVFCSDYKEITDNLNKIFGVSSKMADEQTTTASTAPAAANPTQEAQAVAKMSEVEILSAIAEILEKNGIFKKKPAACSTENADDSALKDMQTKVEAQSKEMQAMSQKIDKLTSELTKPESKVVVTNSAKKADVVDHDVAMYNYLNSQAAKMKG